MQLKFLRHRQNTSIIDLECFVSKQCLYTSSQSFFRFGHKKFFFNHFRWKMYDEEMFEFVHAESRRGENFIVNLRIVSTSGVNKNSKAPSKTFITSNGDDRWVNSAGHSTRGIWCETPGASWQIKTIRVFTPHFRSYRSLIEKQFQ